jgi:hypothetical protein
VGRTGNARSVRWLTLALDLIARRPDLAEHFDQSELARAMLKFAEQTKARIAAELETGRAAATWAYVLQDIRDPFFIPAVRKLFERKGVPSYAMYHGVQYLWNVGSPEALGVLGAAYDLGILRDEPQFQLRLCEALAALGDGRGLADAYQVLVALNRPATLPSDEQKRREWENDRDRRLREAEAVFERASKEIFAEFLARKADAPATEEHLVVLRLLWRLPEIPTPLAAKVTKWARGTDQQLAEQARRLLERN